MFVVVHSERRFADNQRRRKYYRITRRVHISVSAVAQVKSCLYREQTGTTALYRGGWPTSGSPYRSASAAGRVGTAGETARHGRVVVGHGRRSARSQGGTKGN